MRTYLSLLRKLEHQKLSSLNLRGKILDLGGAKNSYYHRLILKDSTRLSSPTGGEELKEGVSITVLNFDRHTDPDILADVEKPLPIKGDTFDAILAMNLLEHVYNFQGVVRESFRVLKPGGRAVFIVPFLAAIHPSPDDFFRYTESALRKMFQEAGFSEVNVEALGYGVMSSRFMLLQNFLPTFFHPVFEKIAIGEDKILAFIAKKLGKKYRPETHPLGYFVRARKQQRI